MNFKLERRRPGDQNGHQIHVEVSVPDGDPADIRAVRVVLDGVLINPERGQRHSLLSRYVRQFQRVGQVVPGASHQLVVQVTDRQGEDSQATLDWKD